MIEASKMGAKIVLASGSPRRVELLKQIGVDCDIFPTDIDESVYSNEQPKDYVVRLAKQKAEACVDRISADLKVKPILAADTTVVYAGKVFGKPESSDEAFDMLTKLAGHIHHVHTSVALLYEGNVDVVLSTTAVEMMPMTSAQIKQYVASGEYEGKAGSYGIQGAAATWIKRIDGSYSGVMGLPLYETASLLRKVGILI